MDENLEEEFKNAFEEDEVLKNMMKKIFLSLLYLLIFLNIFFENLIYIFRPCFFLPK